MQPQHSVFAVEAGGRAEHPLANACPKAAEDGKIVLISGQGAPSNRKFYFDKL
jgi:hypothetical protein